VKLSVLALDYDGTTARKPQGVSKATGLHIMLDTHNGRSAWPNYSSDPAAQGGRVGCCDAREPQGDPPKKRYGDRLPRSQECLEPLVGSI
jgi:hypothetical protein